MERSSGGEAPLLPTRELAELAQAILQRMDDSKARFVMLDREADHEIELSEDIYELLRNVLIDLSQNRAVQIVPLEQELTTVQAAEFLQVSRPYLIKVIDAGEIPCRMVGTHRRLALRDLIEYQKLMQRRSLKAREEITSEALEDGWGY